MIPYSGQWLSVMAVEALMAACSINVLLFFLIFLVGKQIGKR
jgi:hypothetical protein